MLKRFKESFIERRTGEELSSRSSLNKTLYILVPLLIYFLVGDIVEVVLWAFVENVIIRTSDSALAAASMYSGSISAIIYAVKAFIILLCVKAMAKNEITYDIQSGNTPKLEAREYITYVIVGLSSSLFFNIVANLTNLTSLSESFSRGYENQMGISLALGLVIYGVVSPIVEEVVFRGIMYNRIKRLFNIRLSIVITALLFGVFHGNIVQGLYGFIMGLIITWCYEISGSFIVPLLIHITANIAVYSVSYNRGFGSISNTALIIIAGVMGMVFCADMYILSKKRR